VIAAAVIVIAAIVGTTLAVRGDGAAPASDVGTFCAQIEQLMTTPTDVINGEHPRAEPSLDFLRDAPEEIRPAALAILRARTDHPNGSVPVEISRRFLSWWQLRCYPDAATGRGGPENQRDAPVPTPAIPTRSSSTRRVRSGRRSTGSGPPSPGRTATAS
jgi:hypothetical protein